MPLLPHRCVLEVSLKALQHNLQVYRRFLKPKTKMMVMVKASAYGSGSVEVARMLEEQKIDFLSVAYADEGIELRKAGIKSPILVLIPEEAQMDAMISHQLEPEIFSLGILRQWISHLPANTISVNIHLKLDTGMHRLGFETSDIPALIGLLKQYPQIHVQSIFSHLSASDNTTHDDFTRQQVADFHTLYQSLSEALGYRPLRHILNSSGIHRFPEYQMDMVRLGIGFYGVDDSGFIQPQLQVAMSLKARIAQIRMVAANESVGYSRNGRAEKARRIGTISIGYADGLLRGAGNGRYRVLVSGKKVPIVGNVCMDLCMIDLSEVPEVGVGNEVMIFGEGHPVQELAICLRTISYEVFTGVRARVRRVYI